MANRFQTLIQRPEAVLCIDIGNSRAKGYLFRNGVAEREDLDFSPSEARRWQEELQPYGAVVSSVAGLTEPYEKALSGMERLVLASSRLALPFRNLYRSETLGVDRLAAVCGALLRREGQNTLVLDAGTCLTYELVDAQGQYHGGAIAPGLGMRLKAMHTFTARLPLLTAVATEAPLAGLTTEECMQSGALNGIRLEAEGFCRTLAAQYPGLAALLTGGDAGVFRDALPIPAQICPRLVPEGLLLLFWWQLEQRLQTN